VQDFVSILWQVREFPINHVKLAKHVSFLLVIFSILLYFWLTVREHTDKVNKIESGLIEVAVFI